MHEILQFLSLKKLSDKLVKEARKREKKMANLGDTSIAGWTDRKLLGMQIWS